MTIEEEHLQILKDEVVKKLKEARAERKGGLYLEALQWLNDDLARKLQKEYDDLIENAPYKEDAEHFKKGD